MTKTMKNENSRLQSLVMDLQEQLDQRSVKATTEQPVASESKPVEPVAKDDQTASASATTTIAPPPPTKPPQEPPKPANKSKKAKKKNNKKK